jgi:hypothetical protein
MMALRMRYSPAAERHHDLSVFLESEFYRALHPMATAGAGHVVSTAPHRLCCGCRQEKKRKDHPIYTFTVLQPTKQQFEGIAVECGCILGS